MLLALNTNVNSIYVWKKLRLKNGEVTQNIEFHGDHNNPIQYKNVYFIKCSFKSAIIDEWYDRVEAVKTISLKIALGWKETNFFSKNQFEKKESNENSIRNEILSQIKKCESTKNSLPWKRWKSRFGLKFSTFELKFRKKNRERQKIGLGSMRLKKLFSAQFFCGWELFVNSLCRAEFSDSLHRANGVVPTMPAPPGIEKMNDDLGPKWWVAPGKARAAF